MFPPKSPVNYGAILVVIVIGVTTGNLLSSWITAEIVEYRLKEAGRTAARAIAQQTSESRASAAARAAEIAKSIELQERHLVEQRRGSKIGIGLQQICNEWTKANTELNTYTTKQESERLCARYDNFVKTGILPPQK